MKKSFLIIAILSFLTISCEIKTQEPLSTDQLKNVLDYTQSPIDADDRSGLMYTDQGAWFAYSFPKDSSCFGGFSGPFLMTQENGIWSASNLSKLVVQQDNKEIAWKATSFHSYNSHLEQIFESDHLRLKQLLVYHSGHTALIKSEITNKGSKAVNIEYFWKSSPLFPASLSLIIKNNELQINSTKSRVIGHIIFPSKTDLEINTNGYQSSETNVLLKAGSSLRMTISQSFIFPEYSWEQEQNLIEKALFDEVLKGRIIEKETQLNKLQKDPNNIISSIQTKLILTKAHLTLQNNWRIPAGELKHEGLFPSYHYKWFNGFWSWDSWKHAVGLSYYDTRLAKNQIRAMFDFQDEYGFVADCVYRDTTIEAHNLRDTKPPLSAWAVLNIFQQDKDFDFIKELYPKLKKYHNWWYTYRDHDQDGICEYGSTDGSLIAAKWESGMDNAIRFDNSTILKNTEGAYSLDQESVDLNAYLYAEKYFLAKLAEALKYDEDANKYFNEANLLKGIIQKQFYDTTDGWFYDTNLEGDQFIKGAGSEGWTALWAKAATQEQAETVVQKMMDPNKFFTNVPFQTMSADHEKFDPMRGYWRGPNWLDQAYFGVKGLKNYGFDSEADAAVSQILNGADGLLEKGKSIRENYHPLTGKGLNAQNFSWSAAHIIMMLKN